MRPDPSTALFYDQLSKKQKKKDESLWICALTTHLKLTLTIIDQKFQIHECSIEF